MTSTLHTEIHDWNDVPLDRTFPAIGEGDVRIWCRSLHGSSAEVSELRSLLSEDELERASRYRFDQHRNEFILTRATLRMLLASYAGQSPENLSFTYLAQGKPVLNNGPRDLRFNVSHTEGLALIALARGREIGVDVEKLRPEPDAHKLAKRFFSQQEAIFLEKLSGEELQEAFFRCWTLKEAYVKAKGGGVSIPLHDFDVSLVKGQPAALLGTRPDPAEAGRWTLLNLTVGPGYAAALATANAA